MNNPNDGAQSGEAVRGSALLGCPFCGGKSYSCETEVYDSTSWGNSAWMVGCETCAANVTIKDNLIERRLSECEMKLMAEEQWNRRQPNKYSVSDTPQTDSIVRFLKERTRYDLTDHEVWRNFCARLEALLSTSKQALEAADECLALIEDVGHGAMADNVTVARKIVLAALSQNDSNAADREE